MIALVDNSVGVRETMEADDTLVKVPVGGLVVGAYAPCLPTPPEV